MNELLLGLQSVLHWGVLASLAAGSALGILIGVLPGIGPAVAIAVMLPITYGMSPMAGLVLLLGIYCGAFYGGAVTSILIRTPGEASSIMTMFDGYPMAARGEAQRALTLAFTSAFVGGIVSAVFLIFAARPLASFAGRFGAAEFSAAALLALVCVVKAYQGRTVQAALMLGLGLFIGTVGIDPSSQEQRFTFGSPQLMTGLPLAAVVIGVFGMAQAFVLLGMRPRERKSGDQLEQAGFRWSGLGEVFRHPGTLAKSVGIGTFIGVLPAVGAALSTSLSYFEAKRHDPENIGKGDPRGIIAAEGANNSVSGGALVPLLALGIPGDAVTAIILGVFMVHGVFPGPNLFAERPELVSGIMVSMLLINVVIMLLLVFLVRWVALCVQVDPRLLGLAILALCFIGSYSVGNSLYFTWVAFGFGIFGWLCALSGLPAVPLVLGMVLGDLMETSMRQALNIGEGSPAIFFSRPVSAALMSAVLLMLLWPLLRRGWRILRGAPVPAAPPKGPAC
ncbi:tripartite tricarboxylate transporter permease [Ramlibacter tataouinensis]|uniref:tripartite tricarboxylate transporter permease n=1 Tax=Ramlibacter tataouinensis TaxID=94132 RepID=UPI0022F3A366|nr:tripartite tricarboxylate transporter permease [Ramlibacter tataouinensis]WBY00254.1 tripartite tricarboxylate transporter permease [Ramlibacter tataouinensis]